MNNTIQTQVAGLLIAAAAGLFHLLSLRFVSKPEASVTKPSRFSSRPCCSMLRADYTSTWD
jgi:hypothetical protein